MSNELDHFKKKTSKVFQHKRERGKKVSDMG